MMTMTCIVWLILPTFLLIDIENLPIFTDNGQVIINNNISNISNAPMDIDENLTITSNSRSDNIPTCSANKRSKNQNTPKQVFSGQWNFNEDVCSQYVPKKINFNDAQSGVNLDFIYDLAPEFCELDIFKIIFDKYFSSAYF